MSQILNFFISLIRFCFSRNWILWHSNNPGQRGQRVDWYIPYQSFLGPRLSHCLSQKALWVKWSTCLIKLELECPPVTDQKNEDLWRHLSGLVSQTIESSSRNLIATDQLLLKCQVSKSSMIIRRLVLYWIVMGIITRHGPLDNFLMLSISPPKIDNSAICVTVHEESEYGYAVAQDAEFIHGQFSATHYNSRINGGADWPLIW